MAIVTFWNGTKEQVRNYIELYSICNSNCNTTQYKSIANINITK